jgi:hypothetical protein
MGLATVRTESWGVFGMGWEQRHVSLRMTEPDFATLIGQAAPWSPATPGAVTGDVVAIRGFTDEKQFEPHRGRLRGKIVLLGFGAGIPEASPFDKPLFERLDDKQLADLTRTPAGSEPDISAAFAQSELLEKADRFLASEGVLIVLIPGNNGRGTASGGTLFVDWNTTLGRFAYQKDRAMQVPLVVIAVEHYGRIHRLLERNVTVKVEVNVDTSFTGDREEGFNVLGEIAGTDPQRRDEVVMAGAHLDSWASGPGATDNGAGVVIAMEAMRILRAVEAKPKRTIRLALWTGEEQGALGSLAYVKRYIADVPRAATPAQARVPEFARRRVGPVVPKADHARLSAVYTVDTGSGRFRGVAVGNPALVPVFEPWIAPLRDLGLAVVSPRSSCGSDCRPFGDAGIPALTFFQDPLDYETRTHHTNMDTFERLVPEDLRQAAIVLATMLFNTAMRDQMLPRVP